VKRAVYIVPGFSHKTSEPPYQAVAQAFAVRGIEPVLIDIGWRRQGIQGYLREARAAVLARPAEEPYFFGFSMGAMCLLGMEPEVMPRAQILCSLMGLWREDQPYQQWYMRAWAWRIYLGRRKPSYPSRDGMPLPRTIFVYGEREARIIHPRVRAARDDRFPGSETVVVPGARHAIGEPVYVRAVVGLIATL